MTFQFSSTDWFYFLFAVPEYEIVHIHHVSTRSIDANSHSNSILGPGKILGKISEVDETSKRRNFKDQKTLKGDYANLRLRAFGRHLNLSLAKTEGLIKKSGLKVWTVEPNATSQHGVEYVEVPEVSTI